MLVISGVTVSLVFFKNKNPTFIFFVVISLFLFFCLGD